MVRRHLNSIDMLYGRYAVRLRRRIFGGGNEPSCDAMGSQIMTLTRTMHCAERASG